MKAKISFVGGMVLGLLAGSKIGPGLYQRVTAMVSSLAADPRVRHTASTAGDRAAHVAKNAGVSAAHQVKHAGEAVTHRFGDRFSSVKHAGSNGSAQHMSRFDEDPLAD
ncbi:hypothetical protein [Actinocrinis sp.]|uniref:hypothetical protein n=1 Tax=Actinocrinis sp. TaxID=1920516 RepID=UPI002C9554DF|nr:hypothetical protein [Actinocrinis sp.]HXR72507.1 hypothetical protein [Actinocrinis sp.]